MTSNCKQHEREIQYLTEKYEREIEYLKQSHKRELEYLTKENESLNKDVKKYREQIFEIAKGPRVVEYTTTTYTTNNDFDDDDDTNTNTITYTNTQKNDDHIFRNITDPEVLKILTAHRLKKANRELQKSS
jgi:hypothetical protein